MEKEGNIAVSNAVETAAVRIGLVSLVTGRIRAFVVPVNDNTKPALEDFLEYVSKRAHAHPRP